MKFLFHSPPTVAKAPVPLGTAGGLSHCCPQQAVESRGELEHASPSGTSAHLDQASVFDAGTERPTRAGRARGIAKRQGVPRPALSCYRYSTDAHRRRVRLVRPCAMLRETPAEACTKPTVARASEARKQGDRHRGMRCPRFQRDIRRERRVRRQRYNRCGASAYPVRRSRSCVRAPISRSRGEDGKPPAGTTTRRHRPAATQNLGAVWARCLRTAFPLNPLQRTPLSSPGRALIKLFSRPRSALYWLSQDAGKG